MAVEMIRQRYSATAGLRNHDGSRRRALPAGAMLEVNLEEVVSEAEHKTRELVAHCGLEWDETCLATASAIEIRQLTWWPYKDLLQPLIKELGLESQVRRQDQGRG